MLRLLTTGHNSAAYNMALDEALIESIAHGTAPATLRLYGWTPAAISIGYFQSLGEEVDVEAAQAQGVEVVRRMTGGGAVLHEHEITYSIHIPEKSGLVPTGILESYRTISEGILRGLALFSHEGGATNDGAGGEPERGTGGRALEGQFVPLNDIVVPYSLADGTTQLRKISGNAQTRKQGIIVQHGTILLKVDVEKMFSLLKVPSEKMKGKLIEDIKQRVTSLSDVMGREVTFAEAQEVFIKGFEAAFATETFVPGQLTNDELARIEVLSKEKYGSNEWNAKK